MEPADLLADTMALSCTVPGLAQCESVLALMPAVRCLVLGQAAVKCAAEPDGCVLSICSNSQCPGATWRGLTGCQAAAKAAMQSGCQCCGPL